MKTAAPCCLGGSLLAKGPSADICQWTRILTKFLNPNCYEV